MEHTFGIPGFQQTGAEEALHHHLPENDGLTIGDNYTLLVREGNAALVRRSVYEAQRQKPRIFKTYEFVIIK